MLKKSKFLTRPPTGIYFSPALPSDCCAIDFPGRAIRPGEGLPISFAFLGGSGRGCPLLRASNEHFLNVRVLRARRAPGRSLLILLRPRVARARGSSQLPHPLFFSSLLVKSHVGPELVIVERCMTRAPDSRVMAFHVVNQSSDLRTTCS
jgi:hypothetical protein